MIYTIINMNYKTNKNNMINTKKLFNYNSIYNKLIIIDNKY